MTLAPAQYSNLPFYLVVAVLLHGMVLQLHFRSPSEFLQIAAQSPITVEKWKDLPAVQTLQVEKQAPKREAPRFGGESEC